MKREFLEPVARNRARAIFNAAVEKFNYPKNIEEIDEMKKFCYESLRYYNPVEVEIMKDEIDKLIADYKNKLRDYTMSYQ